MNSLIQFLFSSPFLFSFLTALKDLNSLAQITVKCQVRSIATTIAEKSNKSFDRKLTAFSKFPNAECHLYFIPHLNTNYH
jgi:hypothetical protein